jgi:hypothetical protein
MVEIFVYTENKIFFMVKDENRLPSNIVASRFTLSVDHYKSLVTCSWSDYQDLLDHYFTVGQKLVTA